MLEDTIWNIFLLFCILKRLTCPRFCSIWAEADRQCPSPVPQSTQGTVGTSYRHLLGFFPLRREKMER